MYMASFVVSVAIYDFACLLKLIRLHTATCLLIFSDNIDTAGALKTVRDLVSVCNVYMADKSSEFLPNALLLRDIAAYVTSLLRIFGAIPSDSNIGFPLATSENSSLDVSFLNLELKDVL